jgi:hypothetical protein
MADRLETEWPPEKRRRIGAQLSSLGRLGFFIQIALLVVPLLFAVYVLLLSRADQPGTGGIGLRNLISLASSLVMIFTTYWFYRYMRLGGRIRDPAHATPPSRVVSTLWIGFWAGSIGIVLSLLLLLGSAWRMLFVLLANPQTGMLVAPNLGGNPTYSISAIDAVSLTSNIVNLGAELLVLGLTLWLLFAITWPSTGKTDVKDTVLAG